MRRRRCSITYNQTTKEMEIKGPESFIESSFHKIENIMRESFVTMNKKASGTIKADQGIRLGDKIQKPQSVQMKRACASSASGTPAATESKVREVSEAPKANRPPVRKYFNTLGKCIRSEDTSIGKNQAVDPAGKSPEGISIASLKENFGLSQQQIEGIIKDAEKHGRVRKYLNGSYVWA